MTAAVIDALRAAEAELLHATDGAVVRGVLAAVIGDLQDAFGADDPAPIALGNLPLPNPDLRGYDSRRYAERLRATTETAIRIISGAIRRLEARTSDAATTRQGPALDESTVDPDLWAYVGTLITNRDWRHVASAACRFLEHQVRTWAGVGSEADAPALVAGLFGRDAQLALGDNEGQRQGWESIIRGVLMGPRNRVQHGVDTRSPDVVQRFAAGVVGTVSMTLTEIRARYPQQFDQPSEPPDADNE